MSHCIQINNQGQNSYQDHVQILKGIISKISYSNPSSPLRSESHQHFFRRNVSAKLNIETQDAFKIFDQSVIDNFKKTKNKLFRYGQSKEWKMRSIFQKEQCQDSVIFPAAQIKRKRKSCKDISQERAVFIERKYNKELAMKTGILAQLQDIDRIKKKSIQCRSQHSSPLASRLVLRQQGGTKQSNTQKGKGNANNPVLFNLHSRHLKKKSKKLSSILFG